MKKYNLKAKNFCGLILIFGFLFFGLNHKADAAGASLYFSPASGSYSVGSAFKVSIGLDTGGATVNAAEGTVNFNPDALSVVGVSKTNSIFNLWTTEPGFSNSSGAITFGGGMTSGFSGTSGTIITINFQAKANGKFGVSFSSGAVLASDGKGTNVLSNMISGSYSIQPQAIGPSVEEAEYVPPKNTPEAAEISSSTHGDQQKWYNDNNPKFSWNLPNGIAGLKISFDQNPRSIPAKYYKEQLYEKQVENISDGVWYFHLELCNKSGCGGVSHYKVQIDTAKPDNFLIKTEDGEKTVNPQPVIKLGAEDAASGVDYYQIKIGDENWIDTKESEYKLPFQPWGKRTILVRAIDKAGNSNLSATEIEIMPLKAPQIVNFPKELTSSSFFSVSGISLPNAAIKIYIQKDDKTEDYQAQSDKDGHWSYVYAKPSKTGIYQIWTQVLDSNGAKSDYSNKIAITVSPPAYLKIGKLFIDYLTISLVLIALIFAIIFGLIWLWERLRRRMKILRKDTTKAEKSLFRAFKHLEKEVEKEVAKIDGNPKLSKKEKKVSENLKKALRSAEKFIGKEIKDIEKELGK